MNKRRSWAWYWRHALSGEAIAMDISNYDWDDYPLFDCVKEEINRIINVNIEKQHWGYGYPAGTNKLKKEIAIHESKIESTQIMEEDIIVCGNGTTGLLNFITQILAKEHPGKKVLYPLPSYDGMKKSIEFNRLEAKYFYMDEKNDFKLKYEDVIKAYDDDVVAILISNPGNPVCKFIEPEEIKKILDFSIKKNLYIIYDAIFEESCITQDKKIEVFNYCKNYEKLIKLKGFGKDFPHIADFRIGWSICKNQELWFKLFKMCEMTNSNNSIFLESISTKILECKNAYLLGEAKNNTEKRFMVQYQEYANTIKDTIKEGINLLNTYPEIVEKVSVPDGGNVLFIKINEEVCKKININTDFELLDLEFERAKVFFTPGSEYGLNGKEKWFRVTVSQNKETFLLYLKKICDVLVEEYKKNI